MERIVYFGMKYNINIKKGAYTVSVRLKEAAVLFMKQLHQSEPGSAPARPQQLWSYS